MRWARRWPRSIVERDEPTFSGLTLPRCSGHAAAGIDRPQRFDHSALQPTAHGDVRVVQVDGRVAMSGHEPDSLAELRELDCRAAAARLQNAVLVAEIDHLELAPQHL